MKKLIIPALALCASALAPTFVEAATVSWHTYYDLCETGKQPRDRVYAYGGGELTTAGEVLGIIMTADANLYVGQFKSAEAFQAFVWGDGKNGEEVRRAVSLADLEKNNYSISGTEHFATTNHTCDWAWSVTTTAVPEPTSDLLLLVGAGLLALRRKESESASGKSKK